MAQLAQGRQVLSRETAIELLVENIDAGGFERHTLMNLHSVRAQDLLPNWPTKAD